MLKNVVLAENGSPFFVHSLSILLYPKWVMGGPWAMAHFSGWTFLRHFVDVDKVWTLIL